MILEMAATVGGVWPLRRLVHMGIVRGLRALHAHLPNALWFAPYRVQRANILTTDGKRLINGWYCHRKPLNYLSLRSW